VRRSLRLLLHAATALSLLLLAAATVTRVLYNVVPTGAAGGLFGGREVREHPYRYDVSWFDGDLIVTRDAAGQFPARGSAFRDFEWRGMSYRHWERDYSDTTMEGERMPNQRGDDLCLPYWQVAVITLLLPAIRAATFARGRRVRRKRRREGRCPACGYDLRATPDRCPECGAVSNAKAARLPKPGGCRNWNR
jgi:hypothetical protein